MGLINRRQIAGMNCHWYNYSLEAFFRSMEENGFETVALWGGAPHFYLNHETMSDCKSIRKLARFHGQTIRCFTASSGTYGFQTGMQDPEQRERCFQYYQNGIRATAELGAEQMSVNSGWGYFDEPESEGWKRSREMLRRMAEEAEKEGVILTMESLRRAESQLCFSLDSVVRMLREVGHPSLKAMIDTTAMGVAGETPEQWFEVLGNQIVNTHFIDGTPYGHLVWGDGSFDLEHFLTVMKQHGYTGLLGLEVTARTYYEDPKEADRRNIRMLERFL